MKTLALSLILLGFSQFTQSQNGQVNIEQDQKIEKLVEVYKSINENSGHYTIQVGFGRLNEAQRLKGNVASDFPDMPSSIKFEQPTYRVRLGKFKTKLEAERKFIEVRKKYPQAMLLNPEKEE